MAGAGNAVGVLQVDTVKPRLSREFSNVDISSAGPLLDRGAFRPSPQQSIGSFSSCLDTHFNPNAAGSTLSSPKSCYS